MHHTLMHHAHMHYDQGTYMYMHRADMHHVYVAANLENQLV